MGKICKLENILQRNGRTHQKMKKIFHIHGLGEVNQSKHPYNGQKIQYDPHQSIKAFLYYLGNNILKFRWKPMRSLSN